MNAIISGKRKVEQDPNNPALWFRSDLSKLYQDRECTTPVTGNGQIVRGWKAENGSWCQNMKTDVTTTTPLITYDSANGAVKFQPDDIHPVGGGQTYMQLSHPDALSQANGVTLFYVMGVGNKRGLTPLSSPTTANYYVHIPETYEQMGMPGVDMPIFPAYNGAQQGGQLFLYAIWADPVTNTSYIYVNNTSNPLHTSTYDDTNLVGKIYEFGSYARGFQGWMAEMLVYIRALPFAEFEQKMNSLAATWQVSVLPQPTIPPVGPILLHLDTSKAINLRQDEFGTTPVTIDSDPIRVMLDISGNNNHAVRTTAISDTDADAKWVLGALQTEMRVGLQSRFAYQDTAFLNGTTAGGTLVVAFNMTPPPWGSGVIYCGSPLSGLGGPGISFNCLLYTQSREHAVSFGLSSRPVTVDTVLLTSDVGRRSLYIVVADPVTGQTTFRVNGSDRHAMTYGTGYQSNTWQFGVSNGPWVGDFLEMRVYDSPLKGSALTAVETSLAAKWGIVLTISYTLSGAEPTSMVNPTYSTPGDGDNVFMWNTWKAAETAGVYAKYRSATNGVEFETSAARQAILGVPAAANLRNLVNETIILVMRINDLTITNVFLSFGLVENSSMHSAGVRFTANNQLEYVAQSVDNSVLVVYPLVPLADCQAGATMVVSLGYNSVSDTMRVRYTTAQGSQVTVTSGLAGGGNSVTTVDAMQADLVMGYGSIAAPDTLFCLQDVEMHAVSIYDSLLSDSAWDDAHQALVLQWMGVPTEGQLLALDAGNMGTLFQDAAGTNPVTANGQTVAYWADGTPNANHAKEFGGHASTLVYNAGATPSVVFNNTTNAILELSNPTPTLGLGTLGASLFIVLTQYNTICNGHPYFTRNQNTGYQSALFYSNTTYENFGYPSRTGGLATVSANVRTVYAIRADPVGTSIYTTQNGNTPHHTSSYGGSVSLDLAYSLGGNTADDTSRWDGEVHELLVYDNASMNEATFHTVRAMLAQKWLVT